MQAKLHFIAGLPRSGSTLLVALLRQNPRFHARISSPLCPLFTQLVAGMAGEASALVTDAQRERILRGLWYRVRHQPWVVRAALGSAAGGARGQARLHWCATSPGSWTASSG
jgi:hypothetical protein